MTCGIAYTETGEPRLRGGLASVMTLATGIGVMTGSLIV